MLSNQKEAPMRYQAFIFDPTDPAEIAAAPPSLDLADPLLRERMSLEESLRDVGEKARRALYREQAHKAEGIHSALEVAEPHPGPGHAGLCMGGQYLYFDHVASEDANGNQLGTRSPKLSRLKLVEAVESEPRALVWALVDLWRDRAAWDVPTYGQPLTGF